MKKHLKGFNDRRTDESRDLKPQEKKSSNGAEEDKRLCDTTRQFIIQWVTLLDI